MRRRALLYYLITPRGHVASIWIRSRDHCLERVEGRSQDHSGECFDSEFGAPSAQVLDEVMARHHDTGRAA
jgi:hypothetical protein